MGRSKAVRPTASPPVPPPPLESIPEPRVWQGMVYCPLDAAGLAEAQALFTYVAAPVPPPTGGELGWGAWTPGQDARGQAGMGAERLVGALIFERHAAAGMIYGPVVVDQPDPIEVASQLLAAALPQAGALGVKTLFARPQGLDRLWVRFGFIPVPERELPRLFKGRPGSGLFAWRGGSALWSSRGAGSDERDDIR